MNLQYLILAYFCVEIECTCNIAQSFQKIHRWALDRKSFSSDVYFGLFIAKGVLSSTNHSIDEGFMNNLFLKVPRMETNIYKRIALDGLGEDYLQLEGHLLHDMLLAEPLEGKLTTLTNYLEGIDTGVPSRELSDICIAQALSSSSCMISSECMSLITSNDASKGYHKTHQILFALMLRGRCRESRLMHNISMRVILANLCSSVLNELRWVAFLQYPTFLRDLIVEQSKSSLAGFTEFYNQHLIADILSWQTKLGCFTTIDIGNVNSCSGHLSGLAISYLGLLMKHCYM
ncbi:UPF0764 protein C16orf89 homolog isoform X2 [Hermetia illucens]|uniref:UPF0764 protein C16orf89 homolog isoform X2 n=1 Tax=Hermetia illucens TaxID=343691 RepID=UPI0018CC4A9A|nr:UPF0764 protein C16orf89 homolog isoform X2 [Hermetia illucens]